MSDRTSDFRLTHRERRTSCAAAAMLLAGGLLLGPFGWMDGTARGEEAEPPGAPEPGEKTEGTEPPAAAAAPAVAPAGGAEAGEEAGQGVTVATGVEAELRGAFTQLADSDADLREAARGRLMALDRRYLPALQKLVERARPLQPSQAAVLRQIVTHVYLAGEPYAAHGNRGFIGVRMVDADITRELPAEQPARDEADPDPVGPESLQPPTPKSVLIIERMPGFVGHRTLLEGDIIIGLADRPTLQFGSVTEFSEVIQQFRAGQTVRLTVLRRGRLTKVEIPLDPRPDAADGEGQMLDLDHIRRQKADTYWRGSFARLLKEQVG